MGLKEKLMACLEQALANNEAAGMSVLAVRKGQELAYAQAGMANIAAQKPIARDSIFRLYSQSKPITAAAVMILLDRGILDELTARTAGCRDSGIPRLSMRTAALPPRRGLPGWEKFWR